MPATRLVLIPLYMGAAVGPMGGIGVIPLLPTFVKVWGVGFTSASLAMTLYLVPFIAIQVFSGPIAKVFGVRKILLFGFLVYIIGACLCGLSPSLGGFLCARVLQGVGGGFLTPIIMAHIGEIVPERHMGKAIGTLGVAYTFGVTAGPFFSGLIEVRYGWSGFFFFLAAISAIAGLTYWMLSERSLSRTKEVPALAQLLSLLVRAVRVPGALQFSFAAFFLLFAYIGILTFTADYLRSIAGLPSDQVGGLLSITGISGIIASPLAGFSGDRVGRRKVFLMGVFFALAGVILMIVMEFSFSLYLWLFLLFGAGAATGWTALNTMAIEASISLRQPVTSIYSALKFSGYALSPVLLSPLYSITSLEVVQGVCLGAMFVSSYLALRSNRDTQQNYRPPRSGQLPATISMEK
jgi:MFS transporter, ACDE family, multidrug resistance protein